MKILRSVEEAVECKHLDINCLWRQDSAALKLVCRNRRVLDSLKRVVLDQERNWSPSRELVFEEDGRHNNRKASRLKEARRKNIEKAFEKSLSIANVIICQGCNHWEVKPRKLEDSPCMSHDHA